MKKTLMLAVSSFLLCTFNSIVMAEENPVTPAQLQEIKKELLENQLFKIDQMKIQYNCMEKAQSAGALGECQQQTVLAYRAHAQKGLDKMEEKYRGSKVLSK